MGIRQPWNTGMMDEWEIVDLKNDDSKGDNKCHITPFNPYSIFQYSNMPWCFLKVKLFKTTYR